MPKTKIKPNSTEKFTISFSSKEEFDAVSAWIREPQKDIVVVKTGFNAAKPFAKRVRNRATQALDALASATVDQQ